MRAKYCSTASTCNKAVLLPFLLLRRRRLLLLPLLLLLLLLLLLVLLILLLLSVDLALLAVAALARLTRLARLEPREPRSALVRWAARAEAGKLLSPEAQAREQGLKLRTPDAAQCRGWPQKAGARDATAKASAAAVHFHCTRIPLLWHVCLLEVLVFIASEQSSYIWIWVSISRPQAFRHFLCHVLRSIQGHRDGKAKNGFGAVGQYLSFGHSAWTAS